MQSHEQRADEMLYAWSGSLSGSMSVAMQRQVLRRMILAEDEVSELKKDVDLAMRQVEVAESVAQQAAGDRDEALQNFDEVARDRERLRSACRGLFITWKPGEPSLDQVLKQIQAAMGD